MAIQNGDVSIFKINKFLGLNENPDGDTVIKIGEMPTMKNFKITQDNHLQIRPGTKTLLTLMDSSVDISITSTVLNVIWLTNGKQTYLNKLSSYGYKIVWTFTYKSYTQGETTKYGWKITGVNSSTQETTEIEGYNSLSDYGLMARETVSENDTFYCTYSETITTPEIKGVWQGTIGNTQYFIVAYNNSIFSVDVSAGTYRQVTTASFMSSAGETTFFGFNNKIYAVNGYKYLVWDGGSTTYFEEVEGYIPTILTSTTPAGSGTKLENVNRLTNKKKVSFTPDGTSTAFTLPSTYLENIEEINLAGTDINPISVTTTSSYTTGITIDYSKIVKLFSKAGTPSIGTSTICFPYGLRKVLEKYGIKPNTSNNFVFTITAIVSGSRYYSIEKGGGDTTVVDLGHITEISGSTDSYVVGNTLTFAQADVYATISTSFSHTFTAVEYRDGKWWWSVSGYSATSLSSPLAYGIIFDTDPEVGDTITATIGKASQISSIDLVAGSVTFASAPTATANSVVITYSDGETSRSEVESMHYAEFFNGSTDTRVFLYGDGSNKAIYCGIDSSTTLASAEYFPDLYEVAVGEQNTPLTSLCRHSSRMMAYKSNSAYSISFGTITLEDESTTAAFYCTPVNRALGNDALGQVRLLENNPVSIDAGNIYQWKPTSNYSAIVSNNENNAKRISDRVVASAKEIDASTVKTFNLKHEKEFWFLQSDGVALILNYGNNTWYKYEDIPFTRIVDIDGAIYGVNKNGSVIHFSRDYHSDDKRKIDCYSCTGAIDFSADYIIKNASYVWIALQPESSARIYVTCESNRRSDYADKEVAFSTATFTHLDFNHFSFGTNRKPQVRRLKMKVKKATFYRLIFKSNSSSSTATVIEADIKVRYAGDVKK